MPSKQFVATTVRCPQCKATFPLTAEEAAAFSGNKARCPHCKMTVNVPELSVAPIEPQPVSTWIDNAATSGQSRRRQMIRLRRILLLLAVGGTASFPFIIAIVWFFILPALSPESSEFALWLNRMAPDSPAIIDNDPIRNAVRAWHRENSTRGFEITRWWPAEQLAGSHVWDKSSGGIDDPRWFEMHARLNGRGWLPVNDQGYSIRAKIRYRTFLGEVVADRVFVVGCDLRLAAQEESINFRNPNETVADWEARMRMTNPDWPELLRDMQQHIDDNQATIDFIHDLANGLQKK